MELTLSQKFKLSIVLCAIILFVVMFISLATADKKEITEEIAEGITEEKEIDANWCISATDISARLIRDRVSTADYQCEILEWEWCPQSHCLYLKSVEDERYPWKLTADGDHQEIPEVSWTSHEKFKELCKLYWLDASKIWELENKYNLREGMLLAILISETSGWHNWAYVNEWCYNLGNVWNRDNWDRVCFQWKWESIEKVAQTLNNKYLWHAVTLWCLSNAWSCLWWDDTWHRYATSDWNWEKNMKAVLNAIYQEELWEQIDPSRFVVKRVLFQ